MTEMARPAVQQLLTPQESADFLSLTRRFLEVRRLRGDGPPYIKISERCVRYRLSDLENWVDDRRRTSTADTGDGLTADDHSAGRALGDVP